MRGRHDHGRGCAVDDAACAKPRELSSATGVEASNHGGQICCRCRIMRWSTFAALPNASRSRRRWCCRAAGAGQIMRPAAPRWGGTLTPPVYAALLCRQCHGESSVAEDLLNQTAGGRMWTLRRGIAVIVGCVVLADVALSQVTSPSAAPPAAEPPAQAPEAPATPAPTLPQIEVVAPKKKPASPPAAAPKTAPAEAPAPTAPTLPKMEVVAPNEKPAQPAVARKAPTGPQPPAAAEAAPAAAPAAAGPQEVRMSPVGGSELPIDKVPAGVSVIPSQQIERVGSASITEAINTYVPGATINEALGNPLATDLQYRGFTASPLNGTPQGLAIHQNGLRMDEVFGHHRN